MPFVGVVFIVRGSLKSIFRFQAASPSCCTRAHSTAAAIAALACGLFFQQLEPVRLAPCCKISAGFAAASLATSSKPICCKRCNTVLPTPFTASRLAVWVSVKGMGFPLWWWRMCGQPEKHFSVFRLPLFTGQMD